MVAVAPEGAKLVARRAILSLILFGIAFGQLEAAVVVYLRTIAAPIRARAGVAPHEPLPLFDPSQLGAERQWPRREHERETGRRSRVPRREEGDEGVERDVGLLRVGGRRHC